MLIGVAVLCRTVVGACFQKRRLFPEHLISIVLGDVRTKNRRSLMQGLLLYCQDCLGLHISLSPKNHETMTFSICKTKPFLCEYEIDNNIGGWGAAQPGNRLVSFVRAYARSGCLVELDQKLCGPGFSLFPLVRAYSWGFSFFRAEWSWGAFPFPFWARELSLFPSPTPKPPIQL